MRKKKKPKKPPTARVYYIVREHVRGNRGIYRDDDVDPAGDRPYIIGRSLIGPYIPTGKLIFQYTDAKPIIIIIIIILSVRRTYTNECATTVARRRPLRRRSGR